MRYLRVLKWPGWKHSSYSNTTSKEDSIQEQDLPDTWTRQTATIAAFSHMLPCRGGGGLGSDNTRCDLVVYVDMNQTITTLWDVITLSLNSKWWMKGTIRQQRQWCRRWRRNIGILCSVRHGCETPDFHFDDNRGKVLNQENVKKNLYADDLAIIEHIK